MQVATAQCVDNDASVGRLLTNMWEMSDGTRAWVFETSEGWELRVVRRGCTLVRDACASLDELIAAATAAHRSLSPLT